MYCRVGWQEWRQRLLKKRGLFYFLSIGKDTISPEAARKSKESVGKRQGRHRHLALTGDKFVAGFSGWLLCLS